MRSISFPYTVHKGLAIPYILWEEKMSLRSLMLLSVTLEERLVSKPLISGLEEKEMKIFADEFVNFLKEVCHKELETTKGKRKNFTCPLLEERTFYNLNGVSGGLNPIARIVRIRH